MHSHSVLRYKSILQKPFTKNEDLGKIVHEIPYTAARHIGRRIVSALFRHYLFLVAEVLPSRPIIEDEHDEVHDRTEGQSCNVPCYAGLLEGQVAAARLFVFTQSYLWGCSC